MKKNILYIGNYLHNEKVNSSYMHTLGELLYREQFHVIFSSSKPNKLFRLLDMLLSVIKHRRQIDVVLIDTYSTQNFYYAFLVSQLSWFLKIPYIPILHGGNLPDRLINSKRMSYKLFNKAFLNVSPSLYLKEKFENEGYRNVRYIPNGINIKNYKCSSTEFKTIKLLWVRSFSKIYNPILAIKVLDILKKRGYHAELCMVGPDTDGSLNEVKKYAKSLNLEVTFTGKLTKKEWVELAENYNVFINTTNFDNMPVSVIEAMALGLPIVSTNVGGMPYLIENNIDGLLVKPNNPNLMADAIIKIYNDHTLCAKIVLNAREKVEQFDLQIVKGKWLEILS